jgi:hypothetical protein
VTWLPVSARAKRRKYGTCVTRPSPSDMVEFLVFAGDAAPLNARYLREGYLPLRLASRCA